MTAPSASTVAGLFLGALDRFPERTFLREFHGTAWSYREAARRVAAMARSLAAHGLAPGDRLVCWLEEIVPACFVQLACAHAGVIPVHFSSRLSAESVAQLVARVGARGVFTVAPLAEALAPWALPRVEPATEWEGGDAEARALLGRLAAERRAGDLFMLQPTSGTTGSFNLVMRTHTAVIHSAECHAVGFRAEDEPACRYAMVEPLTHGPGNYDLCTVLLLGAEGVLTSERDAQTSLAELREIDPAVIGGPPRLIRSLYKQYLAEGGEAKGRWFGPSAKVVASGGGLAELDAHRTAERQGVDVVEIYGMTETGFLALGVRGGWREGYVGRVLPGVELRIAPDGELLARTERQMLGYWGDPELTRARTTEDGFFYSGDYCEVTPDGWLKYLGRKKDVFNTPDGSNIYPAHIEQQILARDWARQVALVGDGQPFVVALVVVEEALAAGAGGAQGFLDPAAHRELHARVAVELRAINRGLADNERVRRFALFARPMEEALYRLAGQGKIARNRAAILAHYAEAIARLYSESAPSLARVV